MPTEIEENITTTSSSQAPAPSTKSPGQAFLTNSQTTLYAEGQKIYTRPQDDPAVVSMQLAIVSKVEEELRLGQSVLGGMSETEKKEFKQNLSGSVRRDQLKKFAAQYPEKAAAYKEEIEGLSEFVSGNEDSQGMSLTERKEEKKPTPESIKISAPVASESQKYDSLVVNLRKTDIKKPGFISGSETTAKTSQNIVQRTTKNKTGSDIQSLDQSQRDGVSLESQGMISGGSENSSLQVPEQKPQLRDQSLQGNQLEPGQLSNRNESQEKPLEKAEAKEGAVGLQRGTQPEENKEKEGQEIKTPESQAVLIPEKTKEPVDAAIAVAVKRVNMLLNAELMTGVGWIWATALPSFGLSLLLGAVVGDSLVFFKDSIIRRLLAPFLITDELKKQQAHITKQIKISGRIKANIFAWHLILVLIPLFIILTVMVVICNNPVYKVTTIFTGQAEVCKSFDAINFVSNIASNQNGGQVGSFSCSGQYCTNQWDSKVQQYASSGGIEACILKTVIQKESAGNPSAIGHDAHNRNSDVFDINNTPLYNLNWNYSHGIGLTQWTIFPNTGNNRWVNSTTPSRTVYGTTYTVTDFLDPDKSLALTAENFSRSLKASGNNLKKAFGDYNGSGENGQYAADSMKLYALCKGQ